MDRNIQTFFNKRFSSLKLSANFKEELLSPGILFSIFYSKWKIEQWKNLKINAFILSEEEFKPILMTYVEEGQKMDVNSIQASIAGQVRLRKGHHWVSCSGN